MRLTRNGDFKLILSLALVLTGFHYGNDLKAELGSAIDSVSQRIAAARDAIPTSQTVPPQVEPHRAEPLQFERQSTERLESQPTQFVVIHSAPRKAYEYRGCH